MSAQASLLCVLLAATSASANTPADYAYTFPIQTDAAVAHDSSAWRIDLTPEVYAWVRDPALRDIEVFNAAHHPVPFARIANEPAATVREESVPLPLLALPAASANSAPSDLRLVIDRDASGRLRRIDAGEQAASVAPPEVRDWLLDASAVERPIDSLVLAWSAPLAGVVARFSVESSGDLQNWHSVGSGTVLVLEQDDVRLERHAIALGAVRAKYLRLHRLDDGAALSGLGAQARVIDRGRMAPARTWFDAALAQASVQADLPAGTQYFEYALTAALPIDTARIELANDNAVAPVTLSARVPGRPGNGWNELAQLNAFRLRTDDEPVRNGDIALTGALRLREFRIESHVPLAAAPRLALGYRADSFVFLAEGDAPYQLAVGSVRAHRADYPVDAALAGLRAKSGKDWQPALAHLGNAEPSGGAAALQPLPAPLPWRRWLLWGVLIAAAALVGGFALSLLRDARRGEEKPW